ncbi:Signal transduction histidine kinase, LytS [uncultured Paludibacter sp.]|uniref:Signal transduction histidine kinase, LytS n=1 Tax=uncultured Paludibacter sp. TaxID=497635 RepID=A0A653AD61_9BACT|nr:Signal transduction histidine kinase, LytS [uncultured Paludibacter sp.]
MDRSQNKKIAQIVMHLLLWGLFFSLPFFTFWRNSYSDLGVKILHHGITILSLMIVFYLNFFVFIEKVLYRRQVWKFVLYNLVLIIIVGYLVHLCKINLPEIHIDQKLTPPPTMEYPAATILFKDIFPLIIAIALSMAIKVTGKWYELDLLNEEGEKKRTEAELQNLRQQLNPHFLFNTLNNIYSLIAISPEKAQSVVLDLSKLLRYVLYENNDEKVPLSHEIQFLVNYVELMRIRLTSDVKVDMNVDSVLNSKLKIAPMLFIPIVENAFKHGISPGKKSFISIEIRLEEDNKLICKILNSYFPKNENDYSGSGIGLENIRRRLEIIYPEKYAFINTVENDVYQTELIIQL